jgi:hypothetical protein
MCVYVKEWYKLRQLLDEAEEDYVDVMAKFSDGVISAYLMLQYYHCIRKEI